MSKEFVERGVNRHYIDKASKQQMQLNYFTQSHPQEDVSIEYFEQWATRQYRTNDYFHNFLKTILRTENFLTVYKYMRYPIATSMLINEKIEGQLKRVFFAEDSHFKYVIRGKEVRCPEELKSDEFNDRMFEWLLYRFNDIIITDLRDLNDPIRFIVDIDKVVSIDSKNDEIRRIAYKAMMGDQPGCLYIDDQNYIFYPDRNNENVEQEPIVTPHDLGRCPAMYVSPVAFNSKETDVVRKSIFSYVRESMEEYAILKTLQRIIDVTLAFPTVTMIKSRQDKDGKERDTKPGEPEAMAAIGSQRPELSSEVKSAGGEMQATTVYKIKPFQKDGGAIDMDMVKNFINFHYAPPEILDYFQKRVVEVEDKIIVAILGDHSETTEESKNELQVSKSYVSKQDKLRTLSLQMSKLRTLSDWMFLSMKYGPNSVQNTAFYGSDFFLETEKDIYDRLLISPNPIESQNLLNRLARVKNLYNMDNMRRDKILYHLLPYPITKDFDSASLAGKVGDITFQFQSRFMYWIGLFEANYGDILYFWDAIPSERDSEKLVLINNLITQLIKENYEQPSVTPDSDATPV